MMEEKVELKNFTTFKIGGRARYFFRVKDIDELSFAISFSRENRLPFFVLGGGSNLLISDEGFSGVVIKNEIIGLKFSQSFENRAGGGK